MRIIVCGLGQVGLGIVNRLVHEDNDITVIDKSETLLRRVTDSHDVRGVIGYASHPYVLQQAGAASADMLIAVTDSDEVNIVACQIAHALFNPNIKKVARVREQSYLVSPSRDLLLKGPMPIDVAISPEKEVAKAINERLHVPGALESYTLVDGQIKAVAVRCLLDCPLLAMPIEVVNEKLRHFNIHVMGIIRENELLIPTSSELLQPEDVVFFVCDKAHVHRAMVLFGHEEQEARRLIIIGGGNVGLYLATDLNTEHDIQLKIVELNEKRARSIADKLSNVTVVCGSSLEQEILQEVNIKHAEAMITVTNNDEVNILTSMLARKLGCERAVTLVNNVNTYAPLFSTLDLDAVNPRETTVSSILRHIRRGSIHEVHSIANGQGELFDIEVTISSSIVGKTLEDLDLNAGIMVGIIIRDGEAIVPDETTMFAARDRIIVLSLSATVKQIEKLFSVKFEYLR